jgi:hypothetical protein
MTHTPKTLEEQARVFAELHVRLNQDEGPIVLRAYRRFERLYKKEIRRAEGALRAAKRGNPAPLWTSPPRLIAARDLPRLTMSQIMRLLSALPLLAPRRPVQAIVLSSIVAGAAVAGGAYVAPAATERLLQPMMQVAPLPRAEAEARVAALDCATRVPVTGNGEILGHMPARTGCGAPGDRTAELFHPSLLTAYIYNGAAQYLEILDLVEGRSFGGGALYGFNFTGAARVVHTAVVDGQLIGGSTPWTSAIETLADQQAQSRSVSDKLHAIALGAALSSGLLRDTAARTDFIIRATPAALHLSGPHAGLAIAGGLLPGAVFGKTGIDTLGLGQMCLLAAAAKSHILLPGPRPSARDVLRAESRLIRVKARAEERCVAVLERAGQHTPAQITQARDEIAAYALPTSTALAGPPAGLHRILADAARLAPVTGATIDTQMSHAGQASLVRAEAALRADLGQRPGMRAGDGLCSNDCAPDDVRLDTLAVTVRKGTEGLDIVAATASRHGLFHGKIETIGDTVRRGTPTRGIASLVKALAVPSLMHSGVGSLCRRAWAGIRDRTRPGTDCSQPSHFVTVTDMVGRSLNTAFADAIDRVGLETIVTGLENLGGTVAVEPTAAETRRSLATGTALQMSPEVAIHAFATVAAGTTGAVTALLAGPSLHAASNNLSPLADPSEGFTGNQRARLAQVLAAPLAPGGTVHAMRRKLTEMGCDGDTMMGKSGTSEAIGPTGFEIRDRLVILETRCGGHDYVTFAMIGSPEIDTPAPLKTADPQRLAIAALSAAIATTSSR